MTEPVADMIARHRDTVARAVAATRERAYWSPHPEQPRAYGEHAADDGVAAFEEHRGGRFPLDQAGTDDWVGGERSPYGPELGITYPHPDIDALLPSMEAAMPPWRDAGPLARAAVCVEALSRLNVRSHEIGQAVMHTTGQAYGMAFQAGGPHAQDRGLEAVAYAYAAMTANVPAAAWEKPQGRRDPLRLAKTFAVVPRGVAMVVGCNTFPTWNGYPGLFASLVTGNAVLVKPHPNAVLPLAITVQALRDTLADAGFDPDLVALAAERPGEGLARTLALRTEIRIIDYTGSTGFGVWLERNAHQALVFTEKAGVNTVVVDSVDDYDGMLANLAFSLSLYSGQMCTTPQNILVPRDGIMAAGTHRTFQEVVDDLAGAVAGLLADPGRAVAVLGATVNDGVRSRLERAASLGGTVLPPRSVRHPDFPEADVRTPLILALDAGKPDHVEVCTSEWFGPITFVVATDSTDHSVDFFRRTALEHGALTASVYSTDAAVIEAAERAAWDASVNLSVNLTDGVYVNQTAAFSDFHGTGGNPAANATLSDLAYVAGRFRLVESRRHTT